MSLFGTISRGAPARITPFREMGTSGTAFYGGYPATKERNPRVIGAQKWETFSDIAVNFSIVAAGVRYFHNLVASSNWSLEAYDDTPAAQEAAEFAEDVIHDMLTSWPRLARRCASYRFHGFSVQEWTAKRRKDGRIGFEDCEARPQHTVERWEVDDRGSILGIYQNSPQTGQELFLPRNKVVYLVDDNLTDSPEGVGIFRHLVDPATRLKRYLDLELKGYERDLRGIPVGRAPYAAIAAAVDAGKMTKEVGKQLTEALEAFVKTQVKDVDTSIVLDSSTYKSTTDTGENISQVAQWGVELLSGNASGFADVGKAVDRLNREMARVMSMEQLMLGDGSGGNRALSEDKSRSLFLNVNSTLNEIGEALDRDIIGPLWKLNGFPDETRPTLKHSDISFRTVEQVTSALRDMGAAGAVMQPDDPAIDAVRDLLGVPHQPEIDPEMMGMLTGKPPRNDDEPQPEEDELDEAA